jgi:hypothetical protein
VEEKVVKITKRKQNTGKTNRERRGDGEKKWKRC